MSFTTNNEALVAKIASLEGELAYSEREIEILRARVKHLEVEKHISTTKPEASTTRPSLSEGSSEPALRAENSKLREEMAAKDAAIRKMKTRMSDMAKTLTSAQQMSNQVSEQLSDTSRVISQGMSIIDQLSNKLTKESEVYAGSDLRGTPKGQTNERTPTPFGPSNSGRYKAFAENPSQANITESRPPTSLPTRPSEPGGSKALAQNPPQTNITKSRPLTSLTTRPSEPGGSKALAQNPSQANSTPKPEGPKQESFAQMVQKPRGAPGIGLQHPEEIETLAFLREQYAAMERNKKGVSQPGQVPQGGGNQTGVPESGKAPQGGNQTSVPQSGKILQGGGNQMGNSQSGNINRGGGNQRGGNPRGDHRGRGNPRCRGGQKR